MPRVAPHPTPNPDSLKYVAGPDASGAPPPPFIAAGLAAFHSAREAAADPLGAALFAVPGVASVLVLPAFCTVTKRPDADWARVAPAVERVLDEHLARTGA